MPGYFTEKAPSVIEAERRASERAVEDHERKEAAKRRTTDYQHEVREANLRQEKLERQQRATRKKLAAEQSERERRAKILADALEEEELLKSELQRELDRRADELGTEPLVAPTAWIRP